MSRDEKSDETKIFPVAEVTTNWCDQFQAYQTTHTDRLFRLLFQALSYVAAPNRQTSASCRHLSQRWRKENDAARDVAPGFSDYKNVTSHLI